MGKNEYLNARADADLVERIDAVSDRYEMDRSKLIRMLIRNGLDVVERDGIDALLDRVEDEKPAPDDEASVTAD